MTFAQWLRQTFGSQGQIARAPRRGKSRQASRLRFVPRLDLMEDRLAPATLTVTNLDDSGPGSLRAAILDSVNHTGLGKGTDTIQFASALDGGTISLSTYIHDDTVGGNSAFRISNSDTLIIDGQTNLTRGITITRSGTTPFRFFYVYGTSNLTLQGLTLSGGEAPGRSGGGGDVAATGGGSAGMGGAIFNQGHVTIQDSTLTGNTAQGGPGGSIAYLYATLANGGQKRTTSHSGSGGAGLNGGGADSQFDVAAAGAGGVPTGGVGGTTLYPDGRNGDFGGGGGGAHGSGVPFAYGNAGSGGFGGGGGGGSDGDNVIHTVGTNGGNGGFGGGGGGGGRVGLPYGGLAGGGGFGAGNGVQELGGGGAGMGGAVFNESGTIVITNSTFSGNTAQGGTGGTIPAGTRHGGAGQGLGGGVFSLNGTVTVTNSTFSDNTAAQGGRGIFILVGGATVTTTLNNTIIGQSDTSVSDLVVNQINGGSATVTGDSNLIGSSTTTGATDTLTSTATGDPKLGTLQNNGGRTPTMALLTNSPAIDAGTATGAPSTDQRGSSRRGNVDIGAFERTTLTYVANPASRLKGAANPAFTGSVSGFAPNQSQATATTGTLAFTSSATMSSSVSSYAITGSGLTSLAYDFQQAAGNADAFTVLAVTAANLQSTLASQSSLALQVGPTEAATDISAINALPAPPSPVTITLNLTSGSYTDVVASPPANVTLILSGAGGSVTFVGHSPALTVTTGTVIVQQVTFSTPTDSPTILVTGGSLTLRGDTVQEATGGNQPALLITGGTADLGTAADPGINTFNVNGPGLLLRDTGPYPVSALGDVFQLNGAQLTDPYRIADLIDDGLDSSGRGLVTFVAQNAFVTMASGDIQRAVNLVPAGYTIDVQAGGHYDKYTVGSKLLTVAFQNGPTLKLVADAAFGPNTTTLRVTGGPQDNTHIDIGRGDHGSTVDVHIDHYPDGTFAPTGGLVAHGGGGKKAHIEINPQVTLPALLFADGADAHLQGGGGPTVEVGGGGTDTHLEGGKGRNILIAGTGAAHLAGHSGNDILIGGTTAFDTNEAALLAILAEWSSGESYLQRIANLQNAPVTVNAQTVNSNGSYGAGYYLKAATVHANGLSDHLEGGGDLDWVFASLGKKLARSLRGEFLVNIS